VGERWTLLVLRELLLGPQRFSDLKRRLPGMSSSILAERLERLEERRIVERQSSAPPTPAALYALTPLGRAFEPALVELARWGFHFLSTRRPDDHMEPDWVRLGLAVFARPGPTPSYSYAIEIPDDLRDVAFRVEGGPEGTTVAPGDAPADVSIRAPARVVLGLAAGALDPEQAIESGAIRADGDLQALSAFSSLFQVPEPLDGPGAPSPNPKGN
jgi:DNA-binding HxlR family transcriptional regulator